MRRRTKRLVASTVLAVVVVVLTLLFCVEATQVGRRETTIHNQVHDSTTPGNVQHDQHDVPSLIDYDHYDYYVVKVARTNDNNEDVVIHARDDGQWHAERVETLARDLGYIYLGQVGELRDYHTIAIPRASRLRRSALPIDELPHIVDAGQGNVIHVSHQIPSKRLFHRGDGVPGSGFDSQDAQVNCASKQQQQQQQQNILDEQEALVMRFPRAVRNAGTGAARFARRAISAVVSGLSPSLEIRDPLPVKSGKRPTFEEFRSLFSIPDPGFDNQWHLYNKVVPENDLNLFQVWNQGITGKNATVCFLDDGLDFNSPDLKNNYYAAGSYDYNDHRPEPQPMSNSDRHGTRCAGEVAAARNDACGIGIAFDSKVSAVRILSGKLTEADEARAINYDFHNNDIYSCSWGPRDDGRSMEAPPKIVSDAVKNGIINGRNGKGSIFVFASGNGGASEDACNFDGYTNSIYTITVGSIDKDNTHPVYSEECSANLIVMYSSNSQHQFAIYTTDFRTDDPISCTDNHGGTSAAAPLASGLLALVLEIRPELTWRDVQRLVLESAVPITLDHPSWSKTAAGRLYSSAFGYGKLDGTVLVEAAKKFVQVGKQVTMKVVEQVVNQPIPFNDDGVGGVLTVSQDDVDRAGLKVLEHVTVTVTIEHVYRGDVQVYLRSPNGIVDILSAGRPRDDSKAGFNEWTFMTVKHFDENPVGDWMIIVKDFTREEATGIFKSWHMTLYGDDTSRPTTNGDKTPTIPDDSGNGDKGSELPGGKEGSWAAAAKLWAQQLYNKMLERRAGGWPLLTWLVLGTVIVCVVGMLLIRRRRLQQQEKLDSSMDLRRLSRGGGEALLDAGRRRSRGGIAVARGSGGEYRKIFDAGGEEFDDDDEDEDAFGNVNERSGDRYRDDENDDDRRRKRNEEEEDELAIARALATGEPHRGMYYDDIDGYVGDEKPLETHEFVDLDLHEPGMSHGTGSGRNQHDVFGLDEADIHSDLD